MASVMQEATPLQGLSGLYPDPQDTVDVYDEGVLEARANAPASEHGTYGSQHYGYSGTVPAASPFSEFAVYNAGYSPGEYGGMEYAQTGQMYDRTPDIHAGPYPRGIQQQSWDDPDGYAKVGEQMLGVHKPDLGGVKLNIGHAPAGHEQPTDYTTDRYESPDDVMQAHIPGQIKGRSNSGSASGGGSNADVVQGYGMANSMEEFSHGHSMRRVQHNRMPWDFSNTHGEQNVPFMGRHPVQQMPLDGPGSPYFEMGSIDGANIPWEGRIGDPTQYVQPPEVTVSTTPLSQEDVFAWG
jgi:hypothetical protein